MLIVGFRPPAAPFPANGIEYTYHGIPLDDEPGGTGTPVDELVAGGRFDHSVVHVRVLYRVDVDGEAVGVL